MTTMLSRNQFRYDPTAGIPGAEIHDGTFHRNAPTLRGANRFEAEANQRRAMLAGQLTPANTRTVTDASGLLVSWRNATFADRVFGRMFTDGRKRFAQRQFSQDHFRRAGANSMVRTAGTEPKLFEPRIIRREIETLGRGLKVRATGEDIKEADAGLGDVLAQKQILARSNVKLELDADLFTFMTTAGNYATGHSIAAAAVWSGGAADAPDDVVQAKQVIMSDCGAGNIEEGEWVLVVGPRGEREAQRSPDIATRWNAYPNQSRPLMPDEAAIAAALGVQRFEVMRTALGPATPTTTQPVMTNNTFLWPDTTTVAALFWINNSVRFTGAVQPGTMTALAIVSQYGPWENRYFEGQQYEGPDGQVEASNILDDWTIEPIATDSTADDDATPTMVAGCLITGIHA